MEDREGGMEWEGDTSEKGVGGRSEESMSLGGVFALLETLGESDGIRGLVGDDDVCGGGEEHGLSLLYYTMYNCLWGKGVWGWGYNGSLCIIGDG